MKVLHLLPRAELMDPGMIDPKPLCEFVGEALVKRILHHVPWRGRNQKPFAQNFAVARQQRRAVVIRGQEHPAIQAIALADFEKEFEIVRVIGWFVGWFGPSEGSAAIARQAGQPIFPDHCPYRDVMPAQAPYNSKTRRITAEHQHAAAAVR